MLTMPCQYAQLEKPVAHPPPKKKQKNPPIFLPKTWTFKVNLGEMGLEIDTLLIRQLSGDNYMLLK